jgi:cbb3-type cytochrome c oxidase subunit III
LRPRGRSPVRLAALAALALLASGCGTGGLPSGGDAGTGKKLFVAKCGSCHTLADAGTKGTIGPNLDDAFGPGRDQGFKQSTIAAIVADQIRYPNKGKMTKIGAVMPADLVTGNGLDSVALYVSTVAGLPGQPGGGGGGGKITATSGKEIFQTAGCASCHTLADARSTGTVGPNLDQVKPSKARAVNRVTNGRGAMPSFSDRLSKQQIQAVAQYVSTAAGK